MHLYFRLHLRCINFLIFAEIFYCFSLIAKKYHFHYIKYQLLTLKHFKIFLRDFVDIIPLLGYLEGGEDFLINFKLLKNI